jgi:hypothetical protein
MEGKAWIMRLFEGASLRFRRLAPAVGLVSAFVLLAACGADGEPETPTRDAATPSALSAR